MDNRYFENVINEMQPFLEENGFKGENGCYSNESKKITVSYNEQRQMYILTCSDKLEDGTFSEENEINAWLFDDSQNAKDATAVGIDFVNSLRKLLGIKLKRAVNNDIELPSASKTGAMTVAGFTKKMLDVFPSLKDEYKIHISTYGNFLYINFFGEHLVPLMKNLFTTGTKKQIIKLYDVFEVAYIRGDKDTVNIMVALLCACAYKDEKNASVIREMLSENTHFLASFENFVPVFSGNKKLLAALIK